MPFSDSPVTQMQVDAGNAGITEAQIYAAIADVLDPELDEPLVKLGFIDRVEVDGPDVTVVFKLPTFWCAPNFAYLMASDLRARVRELAGVRTARVLLLDHCTDDEVSSGVNNNRSFAEAFPDDAEEDLEELRRTFLRKGFLMRQDALLRQMLRVGLDEASIAGLHVADLSIDEEGNAASIMLHGQTIRLEGVGHSARVYMKRASSLGISREPCDALIIDDRGQPVRPGGLQEFLRRSRSIRMNIMFNTSFCKSMFRTRYEPNSAVDDEEGESL